MPEQHLSAFYVVLDERAYIDPDGALEYVIATDPAAALDDARDWEDQPGVMFLQDRGGERHMIASCAQLAGMPRAEALDALKHAWRRWAEGSVE